MHKIEIYEKGVFREFPENIDEMTGGQFLYFIDRVLQYLGEKITLSQFKVSLVQRFLNIRYDFRYATLSVAEKEEIQGNILRIGELCNSYFEEIEQDGKKVKTFKLTFTRNFVPVIWCGKRKYYGPGDALQDITFCEYRTAHSYFASYLSSKDEMDLCRMIAVLYRPRKPFLFLRKLFPGFDGQQRIPFTSKSNPILLEWRARRITKLPIAVRYSIFLFFSGSERYLATGKPVIDGKEIDFSILYEGSDHDPDSPDIGLTGVLFALAESKVFGSIQETDDQNLYDVMVRLYQVVKQSKALEAKFKNNGSGSNI